jgi:acetyltransferase-like isoleucine patch superfamily enzyme
VIESASISPRATIGRNVSIGAFTTVHDNVVIGDDTVIESHCVIGYPTRLARGAPLVIGERSLIRSHSVLYEGSTFGALLRTGHGVVAREGCIAGRNLQIGTGTHLEGDCRIGEYVRTHSGVHVSKHSTIGDFVWLYPRVQFTNDPLPPSRAVAPITVLPMAVIATGAILLPGVRIGKGAFVAAGSVVRSDVGDVQCVSGIPARVFATLDRLINVEHGLAYPWPKHYRDGYPEDSFPAMDRLAEEIAELIRQQRVAREPGARVSDERPPAAEPRSGPTGLC